MAYGQSANAQTNQNVEQVLQWLMEKNLMRGRQSGQMDYLNKSSQANMDLETYKTKNDLMVQRDDFFNKLKLLPEIKQIDYEIATRQESGQDISALLLRKKQIAQDKVAALAMSLAGEIPRDNPRIGNIMEAIGDDFMEFTKETGQNKRAGMTAATSKEDQRIREKAIGVDQQQANTAAGNLAAKNKPGPGSDYAKDTMHKIDALVSFINAVEKGEINPPASRSRNMDKETDSGESASGMLEGKELAKLKSDLYAIARKSQKGVLSEADERKIVNAWNIYKDSSGHVLKEQKTDVDGATYEYQGNGKWIEIIQ